MKISIIVLISLILVGCVTIEGRHAYTPQKAENWKDLGCRAYQFECDGGEIQVNPIVLRTTAVQEQEKPWFYVRFCGSESIESCDLSFVTLENKISGEQVVPVSAKIGNVYSDPRSKKKAIDCYYYFDIGEKKGLTYNLHISEKVFGCTIDPIPFVYEEYTEWWPADLL